MREIAPAAGVARTSTGVKADVYLQYLTNLVLSGNSLSRPGGNLEYFGLVEGLGFRVCGACWMVSGNGEDENPLLSLAPRAPTRLGGPGPRALEPGPRVRLSVAADCPQPGSHQGLDTSATMKCWSCTVPATPCADWFRAHPLKTARRRNPDSLA